MPSVLQRPRAGSSQAEGRSPMDQAGLGGHPQQSSTDTAAAALKLTGGEAGFSPHSFQTISITSLREGSSAVPFLFASLYFLLHFTCSNTP